MRRNNVCGRILTSRNSVTMQVLPASKHAPKVLAKVFGVLETHG